MQASRPRNRFLPFPAILALLVSPGFAADCDVCPELVTIPAGDAVVGSPADEKFRGRDEPLPSPVGSLRPNAFGVTT